MSTITTRKHYFAKCRAINTKTGEEHDRFLGWDIGFHHKMEGWTTFGPIHFQNSGEARRMAPCVPGTGYDWKIIPDTIKVVEETIRTTTTIKHKVI